MKKPIEKVFLKPARPGMVGDGFRVYNFIPGAGISQQRISPFLMLDFNPTHYFEPSEKVRGVDVHPHKGFETVTIAYKGSVAHHDSAGNSGVIHPGDVQWMTAGAGILHKEYHEKEFSSKGGPFEMVQLWVSLPKEHKGAAPHYQALTSGQMGKLRLPNNGGEVVVIAGAFNEVKGPASTYTPVHLFNLHLKGNGKASFSLPAAFNTALLVVDGAVKVGEETAPAHSFVLFSNEGEEVTVEALEESVVLVMSGQPIHEPIASYGPFVMNTPEEINEAIREYHAGKFGELV